MGRTAATARTAKGGSLVPRAVKLAIYFGGMVPAVWYISLGVLDQLGADPMRTLEQTLGLWALRFLTATLAVTPLRRLGGPNLIRYRRALGLVAFFYATLHLTTYVVLDQGLDLAAIWADIIKRPYITIGMAAFLILIPLAVTSHDAMIRRVGARLWQRIHRWVYLAAALAAIHFVLLVKSWPLEPLVYASLVAILLLYRLAAALQRQLTPNRRATHPAAA
jgi:sulfoxide reductase heme-binding subunit YedZ